MGQKETKIAKEVGLNTEFDRENRCAIRAAIWCGAYGVLFSPLTWVTVSHGFAWMWLAKPVEWVSITGLSIDIAILSAIAGAFLGDRQVIVYPQLDGWGWMAGVGW